MGTKMSTTKSNVETHGDGRVVYPDTAVDLEHAIVERDDGRIECTVYPHDCDDEDIVTRWITADERSFVDLDVVR